MKHPMMIKILLGFALAMVGAQAYALTITPASCTAVGNPYLLDTSCWVDTATTPNNPNAADVISITGISGLVEVYKQDVDAVPNDTGSFASSYETTFSNSSTSPADALIHHLSGSSIACPECILLVKDGNKDPRWYMFDIGNVATWNGTDDIDLQDFWRVVDADTGLVTGSISHVSIFSNTVPEPGILALLGIVLLAPATAARNAPTTAPATLTPGKSAAPHPSSAPTYAELTFATLLGGASSHPLCGWDMSFREGQPARW